MIKRPRIEPFVLCEELRIEVKKVKILDKEIARKKKIDKKIVVLAKTNLSIKCLYRVSNISRHYFQKRPLIKSEYKNVTCS